MNAKITYGLVFGALGIALQLISYLLGLESVEGSKLGGMALLLLGLVACFVVLWLGVKAVRDERADGTAFTYGQAFVAGALITIISVVIVTIYAAIHYAYVNPGFIASYVEVIRPQWESMGLTDDKIDTAVKFLPWGFVFSKFLGRLFWGILFSLIIAAILKREAKPVAFAPPSENLPPPPPAA